MNTTNRALSIIAFYLSEYDMKAVNALGFQTRSEAINSISHNVGNGNNYLKLRRDEFDALPESSSSRKGWRNRPPIKEVVEMAAYLRQFSFDEITDIVKALIEHEDNIPVNLTDSQNDSVLDTVDENKFESLINFSDPTARLVVKTETGTYRVYNQSKVVQLKKLYRGCCPICGTNPAAQFNTNICEAHHISPFSESQNNDSNNIIILCPNHHRLIHKLKPDFDPEKLTFSVKGKDILHVVLDYHLRQN